MATLVYTARFTDLHEHQHKIAAADNGAVVIQLEGAEPIALDLLQLKALVEKLDFAAVHITQVATH